MRLLHPVCKSHNMSALTFALTLVRHGETQYNKEGLLQGQAIDSPLSDVGWQQADAAGRYLKDVKFTNVFVSDMLRAKQTAEAVVKHNASCSGLQVVCDPLLKERSFGVAEGRPVAELREMAKAAGQCLPTFTAPKGETQEQVKDRVQAFMEKMLQHIEVDLPRITDGDQEGTSEALDSPLVEGRADDGLRGVSVHALVVTHGAYVRVAIQYFTKELRCSFPRDCDESHISSLSPNTGLSRFLLSLTKQDDGFVLSKMHCVFAHRADHIQQ